MTNKRRKNHRRKIRRNEAPNFLGQHLMHNKKLLHEIVDYAHIAGKDTVLELGAGKGALTEILVQRANKVLAVEYDKKFVNILKDKTVQYSNTTIIQQDILKVYLPKEKFVVISNIPYSITTPIMKKLLNNPLSRFDRGVIVMEKGAAKRFTSRFVKDSYIIAWKMWFDICYVKEVSRKNFAPPPKVDSAIITIKRKVKPIVPAKDFLIFWGLADYLLINPQMPVDLALRSIFTATQIKHLKKNVRIKQETSVATLSEEQWEKIFTTMIDYVPKFRWPKIRKRKVEFL